MTAYPQAERDAEQARVCFQWGGGAVRLIDPITDRVERAVAWGHAEKDEYTVPFGPGSNDPGALHGGPWVWRYGVATAGTGSSYRALATRIHADVASREGGPIIVTVLSPWQDAHALAVDGWLGESYVAEHLTAGRARSGPMHAGDLTAVTMLVRILLGRES